jgi:glycosyltransferase involved in cell wall biosynthesis
VVQGLTKIGVSFNFDPRRFRDLSTTVYAPANEALRQAAELRRRGRVQFLAAGPTNALLPEQCNDILRLPEIDRIVVPSQWVKDLYAVEAPELVPKLRICAAGVDPDYWKPREPRTPGRRALLYWKNAPEILVREAEAVLDRTGVSTKFIRYGHYQSSDYRTALDDSDFTVHFSTFETQGLSLAEAWSMDVPTIVWNPQSEAKWRGRRFRAGSSCPYLTEFTGIAFRTFQALEQAIKTILDHPERFSPRAWLLSNMTDAMCSSTLYRILTES